MSAVPDLVPVDGFGPLSDRRVVRLEERPREPLVVLDADLDSPVRSIQSRSSKEVSARVTVDREASDRSLSSRRVVAPTENNVSITATRVRDRARNEISSTGPSSVIGVAVGRA